MCVVCGVHGMSGMVILSVSKNVEENAVFFDIFRNEKNAPFTMHFSEVYFGPITGGGCFWFFSKRIPRGILFEVYSGPIRSGLRRLKIEKVKTFSLFPI
jgi:hypothetical protein